MDKRKEATRKLQEVISKLPHEKLDTQEKIEKFFSENDDEESIIYTCMSQSEFEAWLHEHGESL